VNKLGWVLLPLVLAVAWLGWLVRRGRWPSRHVLNVAASLLLLAYLGGTAALGIFWVANQHLPVFDWHYLFGYATVLLLLVHLGFNFRIVWHTLRRRRSRPAAQVPASGSGRRSLVGALGLLGAALLSGGAFMLGLRHGRTELHIEPPHGDGNAAAGDSATAWALVEQFHAFSAHSRAGVLRRAPGVDWGTAPPPFKSYPVRPEKPPLALALPQALRSRTGEFDLGTLAQLLWHSAGVSLRSGGIAFRTAPSSGALFSTELYVVVRPGHGPAPGLWHYDANAHALHPVHGAAPDAAALGLRPADLPADAAAVIVATAVFRRSGHKYRDRSYRYVLADLGHALENLRVAAHALGFEARLQPWFDEGPAAATLGVDPGEEGVLALALLMPGRAATAWPEAQAAFDAAMLLPRHVAAADQATPSWQPRSLVGAASAPLGLTDAMHRATSLRTASAVASAPRAPSVSAEILALPAAPPHAAAALQVIARRRSVRRYASEPLTLQHLSAVLAAAGRAPAQLSAALRIDVLSLAIEGLPPAAWRYDPVAHALRLTRRHDGDLRRRARAAALDQDVIGDASLVCVLAIERAALGAEPAGAARGYRHAFLEAGLAGERLYLEGVARGLGVCAVGAFYDDEAAALVGVDPRQEWVVHLAALGRPG
jgi:SagB-type dehydrogenase family enzyme